MRDRRNGSEKNEIKKEIGQAGGEGVKVETRGRKKNEKKREIIKRRYAKKVEDRESGMGSRK